MYNLNAKNYFTGAQQAALARHGIDIIDTQNVMTTSGIELAFVIKQKGLQFVWTRKQLIRYLPVSLRTSMLSSTQSNEATT